MADRVAEATALVERVVADRAGEWDLAGELPVAALRELGAAGALCGEVAERHGGLGLGSLDNGELTARTGALCGSVRSVQTSQGMAAWTVRRLGDQAQRAAVLPRLTGGELAAVALSEPGAGSDLSAMATTVEDDPGEPGTVLVRGHKVWTTAARYADLLLVAGRRGDGAAVALVPATAPGVTITPVANPMGCRAAGHADVELDDVRLPATSVLGGDGVSTALLVTTVLAHGRLSVAWGCVGILRACLAASAEHARTRRQFGVPLAEHQLVAGHLADLLVAEQVSTRVCEHASRRWDEGSAELVTATVLAKHVSAQHAARGAATAVQVLASAGAHDGHPVARAYRDAKLMEIIEGSNELCRLVLAEHAVATA
ncbi:acyl-CoA dehydrogenase family protein [Actinosynnema pretiosum subsp. pretiosum]|uniref:Acyl-CoA dehydrogenase family protein n=1 Tax=Actinosynnema pretiosum subsp. pretiosum TaxID=103721 RepID=A0AA45R4Y8_9PSEU|nr:acyl-CoA dehydrogenase family protein [Actinosynnema pretiosum subsp. pretiosum]